MLLYLLLGEHFYHPVTVQPLGNAYIVMKFAYPISWKMNKVDKNV